MSEFLPYPKHTIEDVGNKVSWYRFENRKLAEAGAKAARHNAELMWQKGYDFGYQVPGSIRENDDGTFTVVIP